MRKIDLECRLSGKDILRTVKRSPVAIAVLVLLAVFPYLCSNIYLMNVVIEVFFFAALGVAWNVLGGLAKQISWASACFFTIGAYAGIMMYLSVKLFPLDQHVYRYYRRVSVRAGHRSALLPPARCVLLHCDDLLHHHSPPVPHRF